MKLRKIYLNKEASDLFHAQTGLAYTRLADNLYKYDVTVGSYEQIKELVISLPTTDTSTLILQLFSEKKANDVKEYLIRTQTDYLFIVEAKNFEDASMISVSVLKSEGRSLEVKTIIELD